MDEIQSARLLLTENKYSSAACNIGGALTNFRLKKIS